MTYGEYWYALIKEVEMINGEIIPINRKLLNMRAPKRMNEAETLKYYSTKCRNVFLKLGFEYKDDFEIRLHRVLSKVKKDTKSMLRCEVNKIEKEMK